MQLEPLISRFRSLRWALLAALLALPFMAAWSGATLSLPELLQQVLIGLIVGQSASDRHLKWTMRHHWKLAVVTRIMSTVQSVSILLSPSITSLMLPLSATGGAGRDGGGPAADLEEGLDRIEEGISRLN